MDVYGLIGNPVGHSLSPPMHEAAYEATGIDARYVTFEPAPDDVGAAVAGARALGIAGLNVTIPFKESVTAHVEPDDLAGRIGAVNTIAFRDEEPPAGHNTDAAGVVRSFEREGLALDGRTAVVVGAGGAGRAAAVGLADAGAAVRVANRTVPRAEELAGIVGGSAHALDALPGILADADLLVNATSVGMEEDATPVPAGALHDELAVLDAVYSPLETRLLADAANRGATTIDGGRMLVEQGAEAFEIWTGETAPIEEMERALYGRLRPAASDSEPAASDSDR